MSSAVPILSPVADYVRQARHLRARHAKHPARLYQSLSELKQNTSPEVSDTRPVAPAFSRAALARATFAAAVHESLDGPVLRYSLRVALLKQASRLGVSRFEANLVIAEVQHAARKNLPSLPLRASRRSLLPTLLTFAAVQLFILLSVMGLARFL